MSVLIDPQTNAWCIKLVRRVFSLANVHSILSIPLSICIPQDRLVWAYTPNGQFRVSSAYKVWRESQMMIHIKCFGGDCGA